VHHLALDIVSPAAVVDGLKWEEEEVVVGTGVEDWSVGWIQRKRSEVDDLL
jgi:hypothetical protein